MWLKFGMQKPMRLIYPMRSFKPSIELLVTGKVGDLPMTLDLYLERLGFMFRMEEESMVN